MNSKISKDQKERNYNLVFNGFQDVLESGLEKMNEIVRERHQQMLKKTAAGAVYNLLTKSKLLKSLMQEFDFILKLSIQYDEFEKFEEDIDSIREKFKEKFKNNTIVKKYFDKNHRKYQDLSEIINVNFNTRVIHLGKLIFSHGSDFLSLIRNAFVDRNTLKINMEDHLITMDKLVDIIEANRSIVSIKMYDSVYLTNDIGVLRHTYEYIIGMINRIIDEAFPK